MSLFPFREERHIDQLYETDDIYDFIGRGTFASVFKAVSLVDGENIRQGEIVALKVFNKRDLTSEKMRLDVINEVDVLRRIKHRNCLRLLDYFHTPLHVVIVTNHVDGTELFKALRDTVFSEQQVRSVVQQLLQALDYLHSEVGVVHRDVKPENILVTPMEGSQYHVTLVDFGLARAFARKTTARPRLGGGRFSLHAPRRSSSVESLDSHCDSPLIATPCGTLNYAAPETVKSLTQSSQLSTTADLLPRMDVYAVGAILYVMLGGKLPFHHSGNKMQLVKEMEAGPLFAEPRWSNVPSEAIQLTRDLLHFDPTKRPRAREALQFSWFHTDEDVDIPGMEHAWSMPVNELVGDREYVRRAFDAMKPPENSLYDSTSTPVGGRCISVPFGTQRSSVTSYFSFFQ
ncbi:Protein kinase domain [Trypanosoma melophagium]|uniref:Protein kinase domain n=1 Tax=Trypanosoma melophagium TaxID=715481 RepID=UPI00351AA27D|nr:Protein kinase domain [Trypanosoma melophagium]